MGLEAVDFAGSIASNPNTKNILGIMTAIKLKIAFSNIKYIAKMMFMIGTN